MRSLKWLLPYWLAVGSVGAVLLSWLEITGAQPTWIFFAGWFSGGLVVLLGQTLDEVFKGK